jgi:hypothetical protein
MPFDVLGMLLDMLKRAPVCVSMMPLGLIWRSKDELGSKLPPEAKASVIAVVIARDLE